MPPVRVTPLVLTVLIGFAGCSDIRRTLVHLFSGGYEAEGPLTRLEPVFDGKDTGRRRIDVSLLPVAANIAQPTDIQFDPARPHVMVVLEQTGAMKWFDLDAQRSGAVMSFDVATVSEQGLLGMAFHPQFPGQPFFYLNLTPSSGDISRVVEVELKPPADLRTPEVVNTRTVLEVRQPYQNHNAGQLAFGPDGYLYIGWGDGGWMGDPHDHSQNPATWLGSMLRIDVRPSEGRGYSIPPDNPFIDHESAAPETWAYGLRNPWRYSFDEDGRLIVPDVGQNAWEEINIVERGKNYGWRLREGRHCYNPPSDCPTEGLVDPIYEYGREEGLSLTGGYVHTDEYFPGLYGKYIFGDFISGRIWALDLPEDSAPAPAMPEPFALGRWPLQISTFGRDPHGRLYVADYGRGVVYRIDPPATEQ
jgi:glucose/arabinose dehydrogenase